ncbi:Uncharacterized conserved protein [Verrucomicrobium sp. GAS474]|uniref:VF530 family protein n=1 Tax=Verrucomicrobium sp. GAS474 TaxID=1882831 RepID=UPI00087DC2C5|nr:VF530 family protein [Verrucomicrobium sp. GAS474]SDT88792.1 Uncharacterized conserved protein [Verrucomicrobium sp. GAS474]
MPSAHSSHDPLHGVTLEQIVTRLAAAYGWEEMGKRIAIRCFNYDPSVKSSLQFLRKTPWARTKVEDLFRDLVWEEQQQREREKKAAAPDGGQSAA